ncbi:MAG: nuclease domain-containing protein [Methylobacter sp.]
MSRLRKAAEGQECQIRIPGVCSGIDEQSVLCHMNGAGLALKEDDTEAAIGCFNCHQAVDGKPVSKHPYTADEILLMFYQGCRRTRDMFRRKGLIERYV